MAIKQIVSKSNLGKWIDIGVIETKKINPKLPLINPTSITFVPTATGNSTNQNEFVKDSLGDIWFIDYSGNAEKLSSPIFKELNQFHVDKAGNDTTGTGADEAPFLTITKALSVAPQADAVIVNEGTYAEAITIATQNLTVRGQGNEYGGLTEVNSLSVTANGTSVRVSSLTVLGNTTHSGTSPLYLADATINGNYTSSTTAYSEIRDSRLQTGTISKTAAGILFIQDSLIGNATFSTANSVISLRNVTIDAGEKVTIGAGVIYSMQDVVGEVEINAAAIPVETVLLAQGLTAEQAKASQTSSFNMLRMLDPDTNNSNTNLVSWNPTTKRLEVSALPNGGKVTFGTTTPPTFSGVDAEEYIVTSDGTSNGTVTEQWIYDAETSKWVKRPSGGLTTKTTTSLTAQYGNGTTHVNAIASAAATVADVIKLSDNSLVNNEDKVTWTAHGLPIHNWFYLSSTSAGGYTTTPPSSPNLVQRLFYTEDANTIKIAVQEAVATDTGAGNVMFKSRFTTGTALTNNQIIGNFTNIQINNTPTAWNNTTGTFTSPVSAYYIVSVNLSASATFSAGQYIEVLVLKNGSPENSFLEQSPSAATYNVTASGTTLVYLSAGDTLQFRYGGINVTTHVNGTHFTIVQQ